MPIIATSIRFLLPGAVKASFSGFFACCPAFFIAVKTGLSRSISRIHSEMASSASEKMKGIRHPQASQTSMLTIHCVPTTTISDRMKPPITPAWMKLV